MADPRIEIMSDTTLDMVHDDGQRFAVVDPQWIARIRKAFASGEVIPTVIRNGRELPTTTAR